MKRIRFISFFVLVSVFAKAQVSLTIQIPPSGFFQKDQFWNFSVINNTNDIIEGNVIMTIQDVTSGQTIITGSTPKLFFPKGIKTMTYQEVQPVQYNYFGSSISTYLPVGNYLVCFRLNREVRERIETIADECGRTLVSPLSPPLLTFPADQSVIEITNPQFSWVPPMPVEMFSDLNYSLTLVEINQGQSPSDAITHNIPVIFEQNIRSLFENYPSSYTALEAGKKYAWQIQAFNGMENSMATEIWTFNIKPKDSSANQSLSSVYYQMKSTDEGSGTCFIQGNVLFVKYYSYDKDQKQTIELLAGDGKLLQKIDQLIQYGDNYWGISLNHSFEKNKVYSLQFTDINKKNHKLFFSIK